MSHQLKRRSILNAIGGLGILGSSSAAQRALGQTGSAAEPGGEQAPPNFLFILLDKCRRDAIGAYGRSDVHTPNIDRLAAGGIRFDNCYAPQPLCGPCRASILTGLYPHEHGMRKNPYPYVRSGSSNTYQEPIPDPFGDPRFDIWDNFPHFLNNAGYRTAHIGKWHLGEGNPGFFDVWKSFNSQIHHWLGEPHKSRYRPTIQTDDAVEFIEENADRPFFLYQSYYSPHEPNNPPKRFHEPYEGKNVEHEEYYASVTALDEEIGRMIDALRSNNVLDNTFIILTTEHGRTWIDRPGTLAGMSISYDEAARLPLIMHYPRVLPAGVAWQSGVSSVHLMPTIMDAAGLYGRLDEDFSDRSLIADLVSGWDEWSREIVIQNISQKGIDGVLFEERAIRTERWKLILRHFGARPQMRFDELYDMQNDPGETKNLYSDRQDVVKELAGRLAKWGDQHKDALAVELGRRSMG
ncbi:MAG: sulfatase-like hydrolase/transferase [Bryobacterales bacterium]|nr:sulfatase-like hydrolase/transferase [Bryobacterales bacterium]